MKSVTVEKFFPSLASDTVTRVDAILTDTSARLWGVLSSGKRFCGRRAANPMGALRWINYNYRQHG